MNNTSIIGRLSADPTVRNVGNDLTVCNFSIAFDKRKKDAGANFINCSAWNQTAEYINKYAKKGQQIAVQGFLDQQTWEKDGKKQSQIQLVVTEAKLIGGGEKKKADDNHIDLSDVPF